VGGELPRISNETPIYEFVRARLDEAGRLPDPTVALPDERAEPGKVSWSAGALDGTVGHHAGGGQDDEHAAAAADRFVAACERPSKRNLRRLHAALDSDRVLEFVDPMIRRLGERYLDLTRVHELGRWLATTSARRGPVKVGIAVLGVTGIDGDAGVVRTLGAHEEFTLFAAVAFGNGLENPDTELWALAVATNGWGRIQCVERLRDTTDPQIRSWILREGFRNSVMYEYLAYRAAVTGDLLGALRAEVVDRELLTAAGEILAALCQGGPAEDLDDYEAGADAVEAFLVLMLTRAETLDDFHAIVAIRSFLLRDGGWEERGTRGWTATRREQFEGVCAEILGRRVWRDRITVALLSDDNGEFWRGTHAARVLGIDTFDALVRRIEDDPFGGHWFDAWSQADTARAEVLVGLARRLLPLDRIAAGASGELGLGAAWRPHQALEWSLQALRSYAGVGGDLLLVGMQSPVTRNRNMALRALEEWPAASWPASARERMLEVAGSDPNEGTRELAAAVLRGGTRASEVGDGGAA
jgi:hypothetical protein